MQHARPLTAPRDAEETQTLETKIASRAELVVSGMATIPEAVKVFAPNVTVEVKTPDGTLGKGFARERAARCGQLHAAPDSCSTLPSPVPKGTTLAVLKGPSNEMLQLERPVLNIVGRLSGIATGTRKFHEAMIAAAGTDCKTKLLDTRKVRGPCIPNTSESMMVAVLCVASPDWWMPRCRRRPASVCWRSMPCAAGEVTATASGCPMLCSSKIITSRA
jgi:hypothetical protein